jgi:uncharacterized protein YecT (DUF1311 family)
MSRTVFIFCFFLFLALSASSWAGSPEGAEIKAVESKLACCLKEASEHFVVIGRRDSDALLKESQVAWEKYKKAQIAFEMGDVRQNDDAGKQHHATIALRLTKERVDALQRVFEYTLCNPSDIRVRNASDTDFKDVVVGDKKYGDIKRGATTEYQHWKTAYRYSFVSLTADDKSLKIQPVDFVGETPLGEGKFTYILSIENGRLEIRAAEDNQ